MTPFEKRFEVVRVTIDEAEIRIDDDISLFFLDVEGKIIKTNSDKVPYNVFKFARQLATKEIIKAHLDETIQKGLSDKQIAKLILKESSNRNWSVPTAFDVFFQVAQWCNPNRKKMIWQEIGKIGSSASKGRAQTRQKQKKAEVAKSKQGTFTFE